MDFLAKAATEQEKFRFVKRTIINLGYDHDQPFYADCRRYRGFIYAALGAFKRSVLSKNPGVVEMGWIQTGLQYQAFHTLAILVRRWRCSAVSASGFTGAAFFGAKHGAV